MPQFVFGGEDVEIRAGYSPRLVTSETVISVYLDAEGTLATGLLDLGGQPIPVLRANSASQIPLFSLADDDVDTLYVQINGGPVTPIYARIEDRIDALIARVIALENGPGGSGGGFITLAEDTDTSTYVVPDGVVARITYGGEGSTYTYFYLGDGVSAIDDLLPSQTFFGSDLFNRLDSFAASLEERIIALEESPGGGGGGGGGAAPVSFDTYFEAAVGTVTVPDDAGHLTFDTVVRDSEGNFDLATSRYTAPADGIYLFHANFRAIDNGTGVDGSKSWGAAICLVGNNADFDNYGAWQNAGVFGRQSYLFQRLIPLVAGQQVHLGTYHAGVGGVHFQHVRLSGSRISDLAYLSL